MAKAKVPKGKKTGEVPADKPEDSEAKRPYAITTAEQEADFRAHYLYSGNASESARSIGINERTGRDMAARLSEEESFASDRRKMRARALEELVAKRMRVADTALARFEDELPMPEHVDEGGHVTIIDKRSDYGKLVLEAEKNAHNLAKAENPGDAGKPAEVHIHVTGPGGQAA